MNTPKNIDELLKQEFGGFAPEAPDVWSGIEQSMPSASAGSASVGGSVVKTTLLSGKWLMVAAVVASSAALITYLTLQKEELPTANAIENLEPRVETVESSEAITTLSESNGEVVEAQEQLATIEPTKSAKESKEVDVKTNTAGSQRKVVSNPTVKASDRTEKQKTETPVSNQSVNDQQQPVKASQPEIKEAASKTEAKPAYEHQVVSQTPATEPPHQESKPEQPKGPLDQMDEAAYKPRIPGSFSPNGDQINDMFEIQIENEASFYIMILDRKGKIVFESDRKDLMWNGQNQKNGEECPEGGYVYTLRYKLNGIQKEFTKSGKIYLYR